MAMARVPSNGHLTGASGLSLEPNVRGLGDVGFDLNNLLFGEKSRLLGPAFMEVGENLNETVFGTGMISY